MIYKDVKMQKRLKFKIGLVCVCLLILSSIVLFFVFADSMGGLDVFTLEIKTQPAKVTMVLTSYGVLEDSQ